MVKLAKRGCQDPKDASLQMKVAKHKNSDQTLYRDGKETTHCPRT